MSNKYRQKCLAQKINACNVCGSGESLLVHHINGDRTDNRLKNLIPLCRSCHFKVHRNNTDYNQAIAELKEKLPEQSKWDMSKAASKANSKDEGPYMVKAEVDDETNGIIGEVQKRQDCNKKEAAEFLLQYGGTHWLRVHGDDE